MAFKLNEAASERWRYVSSPRLVALVRADAKSGKRVLIEHPQPAPPDLLHAIENPLADCRMRPPASQPQRTVTGTRMLFRLGS